MKNPPIPDTDLRSQIEGINTSRADCRQLGGLLSASDIDQIMHLIQERDTKLKEALLGAIDELYSPSDNDIYLRERAEEPCNVIYLDQTRTAINHLFEKST